MNATIAPPAEPLDARALNRRALARLSQGDPEGALDDFVQSGALAPDFAEAWNNSGLVRQVLGRPAEALADFDRALAIRPDYPEALTNRGRARQALGDLSGALADFDRALACPGDTLVPSVLHNRGRARQEGGDLSGALADFDRALELSPEHSATYVHRALARKEAGDLDGALADLNAALPRTAAQHLATVYHARGGVRVLQNKFLEALADYDRAISLEPENALFYLSRGNAYYHRRDGRGVIDYRMAFRLAPLAAAREVVRLLAEDGRKGSGSILANCTKHLRLNDRDPLAYARRGLTLLLQGREEEAATHLARAGALVPDLSPHLARVIALAREHRDGSPPVGASVTDAVFSRRSP
jgi:tetratricopeptide (TPR) repeat protein